jgi:carbonic anhydrase
VKGLQDCFEANRAWSARMRERDPHFFERLVRAQKPDLL